VAAVGAAGVASSVLVYHATKRSWNLAPSAGFKFGMTSVVLGLATTIVTVAAGAAARGGAAIPAEGALLERLSRLLSIAVAVKLAWEASIFRHLGDKRCTDRQRTARLLTEDLAAETCLRFAAGTIGGLVLPQVALAYAGEGRGVALAALSVAALLAGEMLERALFFGAASSPGMPGGIA
jgi:DMSO reductase anchor subunit